MDDHNAPMAVLSNKLHALGQLNFQNERLLELCFLRCSEYHRYPGFNLVYDFTLYMVLGQVEHLHIPLMSYEVLVVLVFEGVYQPWL